MGCHTEQHTAQASLPSLAFSSHCGEKWRFVISRHVVLRDSRGPQLRQGPKFHITIVCPPTVNTNLRKNSLTTDDEVRLRLMAAWVWASTVLFCPQQLKRAPDMESDGVITVEQCAAAIQDAADRSASLSCAMSLHVFFRGTCFQTVAQELLVIQKLDRQLSEAARARYG